ncbi:hypothetical protein OAG68_00890, partial [bacterium]|nr:hypothetical protein [bacterium]
MPRLTDKPFIIPVEKAHKSGAIAYDEHGIGTVTHNGIEYTVTKKEQFDLTQATMFGLNERLTSTATSPQLEEGKTLRESFNTEWESYSNAFNEETGRSEYGYYVFYPHNNHLVVYVSPFWHKVVSVASSSKLYADDAGKLSWAEIREVFESKTVGVVGCSVGGNIAHSLVMDLRPNTLKVADKSMYKMENINRIRLGYQDIVSSAADTTPFEIGLQNKAKVVARQMYSIDPFINIYVYDEGILEENISVWFDGEGDEPPIDLVVEEVDDPRMKLLLREAARERGIPLLMATDIGSAVQLDINRYDLNQNLPLSYGIGDDVLRAAMESVYDNPGDRETF